MTILMEMGLIHPPVGLNLFVIQGIAPRSKLRNIVWGTMPFIGLMVLGIVILCFFPEIAPWLPNQVYKGALMGAARFGRGARSGNVPSRIDRAFRVRVRGSSTTSAFARDLLARGCRWLVAASAGPGKRA